MKLTAGEYMKVFIRLSLTLSALAFLVLAGCRKGASSKDTATAATQEDTMLMHDLAEANKNTAAASALDNSLNTVRTSGSSSALTATPVSETRPTDRVVSRPVATENQPPVSGGRMTAPTTASDASPTTVPLSRSPTSQSTRPSSASARPRGDPCDSPDLTSQRYCLSRSIASNDADLNQTYQELISQARKSGGGDLEDRFRQSQRNWINQRDSDCTAQNQSVDGKLWARARARCFADYSSRRTAELQRNLNSLRGQ